MSLKAVRGSLNCVQVDNQCIHASRDKETAPIDIGGAVSFYYVHRGNTKQVVNQLFNFDPASSCDGWEVIARCPACLASFDSCEGLVVRSVSWKLRGAAPQIPGGCEFCGSDHAIAAGR